MSSTGREVYECAHMYGYMEKPTTTFCKFAAQRLILKYQFMRDTKGTGFVSKYLFIYLYIIMKHLKGVVGKKGL